MSPAGRPQSIMQSENWAAIAPRRVLQSAPGSNTPPLGESQSQDPPTVNPATTGDGLTNPMVQSSDEDAVDAEAWTQIPGPSDGDMSDSDDSLTDVLVDYHIPRTIEYAERCRQLRRPQRRKRDSPQHRYLQHVALAKLHFEAASKCQSRLSDDEGVGAICRRPDEEICRGLWNVAVRRDQSPHGHRVACPDGRRGD